MVEIIGIIVGDQVQIIEGIVAHRGKIIIRDNTDFFLLDLYFDIGVFM